MTRIRDITRRLEAGMPSWPGDPPFESSIHLESGAGGPARVTRLSMSAHAGTHLDAPSHVVPGLGGIETIPLSALVGPARVLHIPAEGRIETRDLRGVLDVGVERLLIGTGGAGPEGQWAPSRPGRPEASIAPEAAAALVRSRVLLVGIDTLSVDSAEDADLPSHRAFARAGVALLEGLDLSGVPEGEYTLVALPLRLSGVEASPVRAVLIDRL